jgi:hypothetical protein
LDHLAPAIADTKLLALLGNILETQPTPESTSNLRLRFYQPGFSWQGLVDLAVDQEVLPAFVLALKQRGLLPPVPSTLPESARVAHVATRLNAAYEQHLERRRHLREQLVAALTTLNREGIVPVLLKGAKHLMIEQPRWHEARSMRDLDILVRTSEAEKAQQLLLARGYVSEAEPPPIDRHLPELYLPKGAGSVELHIEALAYPARHLLTTDEVWMRAEQQSFAGVSARTLPAEWHLLHGMLHHQVSDHGHGRRLLAIKGLWEFAMGGSELPPEGWSSFIEYAERRGIVDILASWILQANRLFGLKIPPSFVISKDAHRHAEATFTRASLPLLVRRALFFADKLQFAFSRETLAVRYPSMNDDGMANTVMRHIMFLLRRHGSRN